MEKWNIGIRKTNSKEKDKRTTTTKARKVRSTKDKEISPRRHGELGGTPFAQDPRECAASQ
jgi:hypothetical protein